MKLLIQLLLLGAVILTAYFIWQMAGLNRITKSNNTIEFPRVNMPSSTSEPTASVAPITGTVARASFLIYTNGFQRTFDEPMYWNRSDAAFITETNPAIIIIKKPYTTWTTFFGSLPFKLSKECLFTGTQQTFCNSDHKELTFYLNGEKVTDLFERTIHDGDKLLVSYGNKNDEARLPKEFNAIPAPY